MAVGPGGELGIAYAVVAAFVWGGYLFAIKRFFTAYPSSVFVSLANGFAFLWYLPVAAFAFPAGTPVVPAIGPGESLFVVGVILTNVAGILASFRALSLGDVSYVAPISKVTPVFVLPLEVALLGEHLSTMQAVGVVIATLAVYLANYRSDGLLTPLAKAVSYTPGRLALATAALFAVVDLSRRIVLQEFGVPTRAWVLALFAGMALAMAPVAARKTVPNRRELPKFAAMGAFAALGEHVTALAFGVLPASLASPILNTQAVIAVLLGGLVIGEESLGLRLLAAGVAVVGVSVITVF